MQTVRARRAFARPLLLACAVGAHLAAVASLASCTTDTASPPACAGAAGIACLDAAFPDGGFPPLDAHGDALPDSTLVDVASDTSPAQEDAASDTSPPQEDTGAGDANPEVDAAPCGDGGTTCGSDCVDTSTDLQNCGGCGLVCSGACSAGRCLVTVAGAQSYPWHLAVDGTSVYWMSNGNVMKAPRAGGPPVVLAPGDGPIAVDGTSVYWADDNADVISKAPLSGVPDGGTATTLATGQTAIYSNASMAIDATSVYWVTYDGARVGAILKAPLTGVLDGGAPTTVVSGPALIHGIAVDGTGVYWTWTQNFTSNTTAMMAPLTGVPDGGAPTTLVSGLASPVGIAVDATRVYWVDDTGSGAVLAAPKSGLSDGGSPTTLAQGLSYPFGIAVDDTSVYWTSNVAGTGAVMKAPLSGVPEGGAPTTLASLQDKPSFIVVDGTSVYWADNVSSGAIMRVTPK